MLADLALLLKGQVASAACQRRQVKLFQDDKLSLITFPPRLFKTTLCICRGKSDQSQQTKNKLASAVRREHKSPAGSAAGFSRDAPGKG